MEDMYEYLSCYLKSDFISSLKEEMNKPFPIKGLFLNSRRCSEQTLKEEFTALIKDEKNSNLYRYDPSIVFPGRNPLHDAGAYYIMDPSSSEATFSLGINNTDLVLDMCAAPGGKSISFGLNNPDSIIVSNDISGTRAEELSRNVERMGMNNVVVTCKDPSFFIDRGLEGFFSKIILDAPCSGTGMFRKEAKMEEDWSYEKALNLLPIQDNLLEEAYSLLSKGGELLYSTCSFLKEEDEDRLEAFIMKHPDMHIEDVDMKDGFYEGTIKGTVHLFPNIYKGEGHFFAILKKDGELRKEYTLDRKAQRNESLNGYVFKAKDESYLINNPVKELISLPFLRGGVKLTDSSTYAKIKEDHALSHYVKGDSLDLSFDEAERYLRGEEIRKDTSLKDGAILISYKKVNLGYGLKKGNRIRNVYPKGLRNNSR